MTTWWLLMMGGLLGSSHCIGMCGGFAVLLGMNTGSLLKNLCRQLVYSSGRLMSYITLGAVAGTAGQKLVDALPAWINVPAVLCLVSGAFLLNEGLNNFGLRIRSVQGKSTMGCLLRPIFSTVFRRPGIQKAFLAGILTGLLPCGLVYAFVSLAASAGSFASGAATMAAFGIGTFPLMMFVGAGASLISLTGRQRLMKLSAISVMATGLLTFGRGVAFLQINHESGTPKCPFCSVKSTAPPIARSSEHD